ncbi:hypothetical protein [Parabacteroides sp. AM08-6]|uniref:hypothetical protein n=1 Tax=Parabacteroides sp. AM08-6 TaxID=2292053 RepID=UPI000EFDDAFB|nr:hypothetical protein [Parabacteroides sp. AM08-6]RHJ80290.1 hypothetical protein DW103_12645 [Parabacteroides sp. AM08-6]
MSNVDFLYIPTSSSESNAFKEMRQRHLQESSKFDDNFYLTQIFAYLSTVYNSITADDREVLRNSKEEEITDHIRRQLQKNENFVLDGFMVNSEARNQDKLIGYYDLKFEHSDWISQYLVLECKPVSISKSRINAYIHNVTKHKEDDGGLYRFLINKYATNKSFGGMLGYIINNNPDDVITKLKEGILLCNLTHGKLSFGYIQNHNLLNCPIASFRYGFQSDHVRIYEDQIITPIHIFHLFFDFTQ